MLSLVNKINTVLEAQRTMQQISFQHLHCKMLDNKLIITEYLYYIYI